MRTIIIGDIHGCFDELSELLDRVALASSDRVICVGDLIVKGSRNREVLDLFIHDERFSSVLGNHDRALRDHFQVAGKSLTEEQQTCLAELKKVDEQRYADYLGSLPLFIDLDLHAIIHAGLRPGRELAEQTIDDLTELRTLCPGVSGAVPWYDVYRAEKFILFGHWPARRPRRGRASIGLDTGCVYGGRLTAYVLETGEIISVPARRAYRQPKHPLA